MNRPTLRRRMLLLAACAAWAWPAKADLAAVVTLVRPSVVPVGTYSATDSPRFGFRGTGFAVGDGSVVATNLHVLPTGADSESGPQVAVLAGPMRDGRGEVRRVRVIATDRAHDLALLKLDGPMLPALVLDEPGNVREGQAIALMGFPIGGVFGFSPVTHRGIVASITTVALQAAVARQLDPRAIERLRDGNFEVLQLDATAYPGNSGGPLFDAESGRVVGIVNMVLVKGSRESALSQPTGITYAIPVRHLRALLGEVQPPAPSPQTR